MRYPLNYIGVTQKFSKTHKGIDLGWNSKYGGKNVPVYAVDDGVVIYNRKQTTGGYVIHIRHDNGLVSEYGHLLKDSQTILEGYKVKKGQMIARMGNSGISFGNHLHFGLYKGTSINYNVNNWVNPFDYLCLYDNQTVNAKTTNNGYVKFKTKKVVGADEEGLNVRKGINGKVVGTYKNGTELESFGVERGWNIVDNVRGYYCSNKYVK